MRSLCEVVEERLIHYPTTQTEQEQELVVLEQPQVMHRLIPLFLSTDVS
jgi:hypothetical protein